MNMPVALGIVLAAVGGLCAGSFFNVVGYRLPRGESLVSPGSRCPSCGVAIKPYDNVPVLGWLLLRGRCRQCHETISWRYPLVEALTGALAVSVVLVKHGAHDIALGLALVGILVPISLIDIESRKIPNKITAPAAIAAIVIGLVTKPSGVPTQLIGGAGAGLAFFLIVMAYPRGMGLGDVKLAGVMGLFLGASVVPALFAGVLSGAVVGGAVMARVGVQKGRKTAIPFGPFLAIGGIVGILVGPSIVHWYVHSVVH
jgi:leader peptidase (prepilin peptidase)/N-methyltransferase